jgi:manganese/zinc-transporting P-type ATPase C
VVARHTAANTIVFDKTGAVAVGRPVVANIGAMHKDWQPEQVLAYAASSEIHCRRLLAETPLLLAVKARWRI